ncbi:MAG: hypothetical protein M3R51_02710 [Candidatus Eremiobacteraeota bacterium]|nr:hypothetical protein [Candidatus Eremiobacteraeota bacterium]
MRRSVAPFIVAFSIVMIVLGWFVYHGRNEFSHLASIGHVKASPSRIYVRMTIAYDNPPVYEEEYRMEDIEGISTFDYRIRTYQGKQVTITAPKHAMYDVSFFFGKIDQLGVWKLVNKPPRGNTSVHYTIYVKQVADFQQGDRTIVFTDPHYWATTAGRQYEINLSKNDPRDLLKMQSASLADPRYAQIVDEFHKFGPRGFRERVAKARASAFGAK